MATTRTTAGAAIDRLRTPFPVEDVKTRRGGGGKNLDYVAIETVLARLLDEAPGFCWGVADATVTPRVTTDDDGNERVSFTAVVTGRLTVGDKFADGVGAMINPDPDMAVKSANSEAMKNAAKNGFGVALELWDAEYRAGLERRRKLVGATEATLKNEVFRLATERLGRKPKSAKEAAEVFGVDTAQLADESGLRQILEGEGVL